MLSKGRRRLAVILPLGLLIAGGLGGARGYAALCAGPLDTYPAIAAVQTAAQLQAGSQPPASAPAAWAGAEARVLQTVLAVKQSDYIAFPAHALAGFGLEAGGCPAAATADQWRKAAGHAWFDWPARIAAAGLARTAHASGGPDGTPSALQAYAQAEPWHAANLQRVHALYQHLAARGR